MSNLKHEVEPEECHKTKVLQKGSLELPAGHAPQTIHVACFGEGNDRIPAFGLRDHGDFYPDGFSWRSDKEPLQVTFAFDSDIAGIRCDHHELKCSSKNGTQSITIPPASARTEYDFDVNWATGGAFDPKIVVTPINN